MTTTVRVTDSAGHITTQTINLTVTAPPSSLKIIGMSAPASTWNQRLSEVGSTGIRARRIFADLTSSGNDQSSLITAAHNADMMPVVSYKVPSVASAITGSYDAWATATANYLNSFGKPVAACIWHEPRGDMTPAQYVQLQERLVPLMKRTNVKVGPILNGFLLTGSAANKAEFPTYVNDNLLNIWDWFGIDTYHLDAGSTVYSGDRVPPLVTFLNSKGHGDMLIGIGEYNGLTTESIADSGEVFLSTPSLWFACVWNNDLNTTTVLSGDRLAAFRSTKADARVMQ